MRFHLAINCFRNRFVHNNQQGLFNMKNSFNHLFLGLSSTIISILFILCSNQFYNIISFSHQNLYLFLLKIFSQFSLHLTSFSLLFSFL